MIFIIKAILQPFEFLNVRFSHGALTGCPCFAGAQACPSSLPPQEELLTLPAAGVSVSRTQGSLMSASHNAHMGHLLCAGL